MIFLTKVHETPKNKYFSVYIQDGNEIKEYKPTFFNNCGDIVPLEKWRGIFVKTPQTDGQQRPLWSFKGVKNDLCVTLVEKLKKEFDGEKIIYLMGYPHPLGDTVPW